MSKKPYVYIKGQPQKSKEVAAELAKIASQTIKYFENVSNHFREIYAANYTTKRFHLVYTNACFMGSIGGKFNPATGFRKGQFKEVKAGTFPVRFLAP